MKNYLVIFISMIVGVFLIIGIGVILLPKCKDQPTVFRIATNDWPGYEMLYLARELGFYDGKNIRIIEVPSTSMILRGLRNGTLEAGCVTLDEALTLLQDSIDIRVVLVMDESRGGDVLLAKPEINSLQELRGKRIGLENLTVSAILLDAALEKAGLKIEDVTLVPMSINNHLSRYLEGKVEAVATFEPVKSQLLAKKAKILFSSDEIPGRIIDIMVVRGNVVEKYNNELHSLLQGYFQALTYFNKNQQTVSKFMEKRLGKNVLEQFSGLYLPNIQENNRYLKGKSPQLYKSAQILIEIMTKRKLLRHKVSNMTFADPQFLPNN